MQGDVEKIVAVAMRGLENDLLLSEARYHLADGRTVDVPWGWHGLVADTVAWLATIDRHVVITRIAVTSRVHCGIALATDPDDWRWPTLGAVLRSARRLSAITCMACGDDHGVGMVGSARLCVTCAGAGRTV